ncbi:hypothetical protein ABC977_07645 [Thioalkalicoccus limnaeus]|uniref:Tetratricopeptide repeat protein n=1 Tax=Thioalkalicoccus limnaeus TaxID=120681 RepID=A0ABV4BG71_9GAMM
MRSIGDLVEVGGADRRRRLSGLAALALAALVPWVLWGLLSAPVNNDCDGACAADGDREAALAAWQHFWSDLAERGETALHPAAADPSLRAAGDTAFMRYRNLWGSIDRDAREAFQNAALSSDPDAKVRLLHPWTMAADKHVRFRARLEIARIHLRRRDLAAAEAMAREALAVADLVPAIVADAYFVLGAVAFEARDLDRAEEALARAVAADPGFWDARQMHLAVLAEQLGQPRQGTAPCLNRTREMIEHLGALPALAEDRTQYRDLADRFALASPVDNPALALLAGLGYLWSGDLGRARDALTRAEGARGPLPGPCADQIRDQARAYRATLE